MCNFCEGKEPIQELYEGYTPGPIWFGKNGVITSMQRANDSRIHRAPDAPPSMFSKFDVDSICSDIEKMKELNANVMVPGSEESTYYRFKFCPECGRKLIEETNESRP